MPNAFKLFLGLGLFCSAIGCGPGELPFTDNSKDSVAFALSMKGLVLNTTENINNILIYFKQEVLSPPRLAGQVLLVHESLNAASQPRKGRNVRLHRG